MRVFHYNITGLTRLNKLGTLKVFNNFDSSFKYSNFYTCFNSLNDLLVIQTLLI